MLAKDACRLSERKRKMRYTIKILSTDQGQDRNLSPSDRAEQVPSRGLVWLQCFSLIACVLHMC